MITLFSRLCTSQPAESAVFKLVWRLTARDRKFKLKTYPTFGYLVIVGAVLTIFNDGKFLEAIQSLPQTKKYLIFLYLGCFLIPTVVLQQRFSDQYEASWIYYALPFHRPGDILKGGLKAILIKYGLSIFSILAVVVLMIWGLAALDDILLAMVNMIISTIILAWTVRKDLPFSRSYVITKEAKKSAAQFVMLVVPAGLGLFHFILTFIPFGVAGGILLGVLLTFFITKLFTQVSWLDLNVG